jgi:protein-L-isoaspartate(D-aspartate) O-methyltransferase
MRNSAELRERMVTTQIAGRGVRDPAVLAAMREVPRELFVPDALSEFAYHDASLPINQDQVILPPFVVAVMLAALRVARGDRVLEIGTGAGYAAAVLAQIADEVFAVEPDAGLAELAEARLRALDYSNIQLRVGDTAAGWPQYSPYDAILVTTTGIEATRTLLDQLRIGGRLLLPVGSNPREQGLVRVTRTGMASYEREELGGLHFVPVNLDGAWKKDRRAVTRLSPRQPAGAAVPALVKEAAEPIEDITAADLRPLLDRIGDARVVLLGEATHGTTEFYQMRARITQELIRQRGFSIVAVEADWPDAARIDRYVRHLAVPGDGEPAFTRFPTWMWRNEDVNDFVEWLRGHNELQRNPDERVGFYGLDLYSMYTSIGAVLHYLDEVDPDAARLARHRYGCLMPWEQDPSSYGEAALTGRYRLCEAGVVAMLADMLARRLDYSARDGDRFLNAVQNARLVASAEQYYRVMYYGSVESWNLRDRHMFETLEQLLAARGPEAKAVIWEHNSHVGDAAATEMGASGEFNVGHLARRGFGPNAFLVGFGTDHGTVAAASRWDGPMEVKSVRPAHRDSYERLCHDTGIPAFTLALRHPRRPEVREELLAPRLERAIGVIYRPESEMQSHYFQASLPRQFDEYVWFDETHAVTPLGMLVTAGVPETWPFGL